MRSIAAALTVILLLATLFCVPAYGAAPWTEETPVGEILFHQSFADLSEFAKTGWTAGTSTAEGASVSVTDGMLAVKCRPGRAYVIMPDVKRGTSYTVEFTFRFTESGMQNGSLSFLLTCRGEEPTNITSLVIRGSGQIDDFSAPDEEIAKAIQGGMKVTAEIPVEDGALHRMNLTAGDASCTVERSSVLMIAQERMGFAVRNTGAAVSEIWLVNGVGYEKKTGDTTSYAVEPDPVPSGEKPGGGKSGGSGSGTDGGGGKTPGPRETSPRTGDPLRERSRVYGQVAVMSGGCAVLICGFYRRRKAGR